MDQVSSYVLTEDLELCDKDSAHLPVRVPADDNDPYCMVGGGEMNLEAGIKLIQQFHPAIVVCAYGGRSKYLGSINAPSESEVMSAKLSTDLDNLGAQSYIPAITIWQRQRQLPVPANTRQELLNIFDLALKSEMHRIAIVTVGVHVPRTATYVSKHLSTNPKYQALSPVVFESEEVLLAADRARYIPRVEAMRQSQSFARNWEREAIGTSKIVRDVYGDAKPQVAVAGS